jgi:HemY protein
LRANPSERVCLLMADIEEGENGDQGRVRMWLTRAINAPRDPAWIADGRIFPAWAPLSPLSGTLDGFEWRVAAEAPPARLPLDMEARTAPPTLPLPTEPTTRAGTPTRAASGGAPDGPPVVAAQPLAPAVPVLQAGGAPPKGVRPMARAPDDPGPISPDEDEGGDDLIVFRPGRMA